MGNTKNRTWLYWGLAALAVPIVAVVFLIIFFVGSLPDRPTRADARAEAGQILDYIDEQNVDALQDYFRSSYPPGARELLAACGGVAELHRTVHVSGSADFPGSFRITVDGVAKSDSQHDDSCTFGLSREERHWIISAL